jgi:hypothetical protein
LDFGICHLGYKEAEANSSPKSRGNPGFREIPVRSGPRLGQVTLTRPPGEPYGAAWAASRADRRRSTIINGRP